MGCILPSNAEVEEELRYWGTVKICHIPLRLSYRFSIKPAALYCFGLEEWEENLASHTSS